MSDFEVTTHTHHYEHTHAWGNVPHTHFLRQVCPREECSEFATHDIHPDREDHQRQARKRAAEGLGFEKMFY